MPAELSGKKTKTMKFKVQLSQTIETAKQNNVNKFAQRLVDPNTNSKRYWSQLKTLLNGKKNPCIPPPFHDNIYIVDFQLSKKKVSFSILFSLANVV